MLGKKGARSPHEVFYHYYAGGELQAIRDRRWKLHFPHGFRTMAGRKGGSGGSPAKYERGKIGLALFDLKNDRDETKDVAAEHPEIVKRLQLLGEVAREDLGDKLQKRKGAGRRRSGRLGPDDARLVW